VDAGAGTAAFARQLRLRRLTVVELDISAAMLRHDRAERPMAVVGDVTALPLRDGCVDLTVAGFVLSHLDDAGRGLSELVRITKPGGTVLATSFPAGSGVPVHPAKVAVDDVLNGYGYRAPDWYLALKSAGEEQVGSRIALAELAAGVGLDSVTAERLEVDIGHLGVDALVGWRLGMAQVAPWLRDEPAERRERIRSAARSAVRAVPMTPLTMLVLRGCR
jgi:SAM-dependent methyltransferase